MIAVYRFQSEEQPAKPLRLKIEINSREHFTELGYVHSPFAVQSRWWSGAADITTFALEEMLGTKLRALYQRRKGRDVLDLWYALTYGAAAPERIVACFDRYMREGGHRVTRAVFAANLQRKLADPLFRADMSPLLRPGIGWDMELAVEVVTTQLLALLSGEP